MPTSAIFCLASSRGRTDRIISELKDAAFTPAEIGVLFRDRTIPNDPERDRQDRATLSPDALLSAGQIRGVLGWVAGISRLIVPGVGAFIAAGPITHTLRLAQSSSEGVAIAHALTGLGLPAAEATRFEQRLKFDSHFLISVHTTDPARIARTREIFEASHGEAVCTALEPLATTDRQA